MLLCYSGTDRELAKKINHSVQAIQIRRHRVKKKIQENIIE